MEISITAAEPSMPTRQQPGGVIHTYQRYDPKTFPSPTQPPPDVVSSAFDHLLAYGSLREKYQVDELAAKYEFTGRTGLTIAQALAVKEELEEIDKLLKQLEEAARTAQIAVIDVEELARYAEPGEIENLNALQQQIEDY